MDKAKFGSIVSTLGRSELTSLEKQFTERVREYFEKNGRLTEQQESILEGINREKVRWMKKGVQGEAAYTVNNAI